MKFLNQNRVYIVTIFLIVLSICSIFLSFYFFGQTTQQKTLPKIKKEIFPDSIEGKVLGDSLNFSADFTKEGNLTDDKGSRDFKQFEEKNEIDLFQEEIRVNDESTQTADPQKIIKLKYKLNNFDEKYGFDLPAVKLYYDSQPISQLHRDTAEKSETIYLDPQLFQVENIDLDLFEYEVVSTYDTVNTPKFVLEEKSFVSEEAFEENVFTEENLSVDEVVTDANNLIVWLQVNDSQQSHQPLFVRLITADSLTLPNKINQYFDQAAYIQLQTLDTTKLFHFELKQGFSISNHGLLVCVTQNKCSKLSLQE